MYLSLRSPRGGGAAVAIIFSILAAPPATATSGRKNTTFFIATDGIACLHKADILKVRQAITSLRYLGQIRALVNDNGAKSIKQAGALPACPTLIDRTVMLPIEIKTNETE